MQNIKWLVTLANSKPLLFIVAFLLIICFSLVLVIKEQEKKIKECGFERKIDQNYYNARVDSLNYYYIRKEAELNTEVKRTLNTIIDSYKDQLKEQKVINEKINNTTSRNRELINENRKHIKKLYRAQ